MEKNLFEVDSNNHEFRKIEKVLLGKVSLPKIATVVFDKASLAQQKLMLKKAYQDGLRAAGAVLSKNIHCFMADHPDDNPSMQWNDRELGYHCYGCMENRTFDVFDAITIVYNLAGKDWFRDSCQIAVNLFVKAGAKIVIKGTGSGSTYVPITKEMYKVIGNKHHIPIELDSYGIEYLKAIRGISISTAKRFKLMTWDYNENSYLVFPNDDGSYARRLFRIGEGNPIPSKKWWNKANDSIGLFNQRALLASRDAGKVIFVTESAIDSLTVEEAGFYSLALNGIANMHKLSKLVFSDKDHHAYMIVGLLDNDEHGISKAKYFTSNKFFLPDYLQAGYSGNRFLSRFKDVNEAWVADPAQTKTELSMIAKEAEAFYENGGLTNG